jgi:hypothetical protein
MNRVAEVTTACGMAVEQAEVCKQITFWQEE